MKKLILVLFISLFASQYIAAQFYKIELVKDIYLGNSSSGISDLVKAGSNLYFTANDNLHGKELWKSDGTTVGTQMVMDINNVGSASSSPNYLTVMDGNVFFSANDGTNGSELWRSQYAGAAAGFTGMVKNINPGAGSSNASSLTNMSGILMFAASNGIDGKEIWKSDGTSATTLMVEDFISGSNGILHSEFIAINNTIYFAGGSFDRFLYQSTTTNVSGPIMVDDYDDNFLPGSKVRVNERLFLSGVGRSGANIIGRELFIKNEGENIKLVRDINVGEGDSDPFNLINVNGTLFFTAHNGTARSLWKSDGTTAGTVVVKTITNDTSFFEFCAVGDLLFFCARNANGIQLWKSNGTTNGTVLVKTINPTHDDTFINSIDFNGKLVFSIFTDSFGHEIWQSDGTESGTYMIKDLNPAGDSNASYFTKVNDVLYFTANNGVNGFELYKMYNCFGSEYNFTTKNGNWNDQTVWSCGRVPATTEQITIKGHTININGNFGVNKIIFEGGNVTIPVGSTLTYYPILP